MSIDDNKAIIRRYLEEAWNRGNLDIIDEVAAPDYARYLSGQNAPLDRAGQKQRIASFRAGLPDVRLSIDDLIAEGDRVVFRITLRGTQTGMLMGIAPTGRSVTISAIDIARLSGGKIVEHWGQMDALGIFQQLGATPPPAAG